jgi:hypothetical protein
MADVDGQRKLILDGNIIGPARGQVQRFAFSPDSAKIMLNCLDGGVCTRRVEHLGNGRG